MCTRILCISSISTNHINLVISKSKYNSDLFVYMTFGILVTDSNHVFQQETFHITSDSEATLVVHITQELTEALKAFCEKKAAVSSLTLTRVVLPLGRKEWLNSLC